MPPITHEAQITKHSSMAIVLTFNVTKWIYARGKVKKWSCWTTWDWTFVIVPIAHIQSSCFVIVPIATSSYLLKFEFVVVVVLWWLHSLLSKTPTTNNFKKSRSLRTKIAESRCVWKSTGKISTQRQASRSGEQSLWVCVCERERERERQTNTHTHSHNYTHNHKHNYTLTLTITITHTQIFTHSHTYTHTHSRVHM